MSLQSELLVCPGSLYVNPSDGVASSTANWGTFLGETESGLEPEYSRDMFDVVKESGSTPITKKEVGIACTVRGGFLRFSTDVKKMALGDGRVDSTGAVSIPGPDSVNAGNDAPSSSYLFVPRSYANTASPAYNMAMYIPKGIAEISEPLVLDRRFNVTYVEIFCAEADVPSTHSMYNHRALQIDNVNNITIGTT